MNRDEVKKILKARNEMKNISEQMKEDVSITVENESLINICDKAISSLEENIEKIDTLLLDYCESTVVGTWLLKIKGMTVDIAAGLLVHYDVKDKVYAAQFIRYAGVGSANQGHSSNEIRKMLTRLNENFCKEQNSFYEDYVVENIKNVSKMKMYLKLQRA